MKRSEALAAQIRKDAADAIAEINGGNIPAARAAIPAVPRIKTATATTASVRPIPDSWAEATARRNGTAYVKPTGAPRAYVPPTVEQRAALNAQANARHMAERVLRPQTWEEFNERETEASLKASINRETERVNFRRAQRAASVIPSTVPNSWELANAARKAKGAA